MKIKHLRKRRNGYYYQRRVPTKLVPVIGVKAYLRTLETSDLTTAVKRADEITAQWDALLASSNTGTLYNEIHARTVAFPSDLEDLFAYGTQDEQQATFTSLPESDQMRWRAAQEKLTGRPRDPMYMYSLMDGLAALAKVKKATLPDKTWALFPRAVKAFGDQAMAKITRPTVAKWIDGTADAKEVGTIKIMLSSLGQIYEHCQTRGHIPDDRGNPFRNHKFGPHEIKSYEFMDDALLSKVMAELTPEDRLIALVARYSGLRMTEIFTSPVRVIEGILSFDVVTSKTKAGVRVVPVRKEIADLVEQNWATWGDPSAFSKRFGRAKKKVLGAENRRSMSFHSLRVSFITYVGRAKYTEQQCAWLVGHEEGKGTTMSGSLYFKGYDLSMMKEMVEAVPAYVKTPNHV